MTYERISGEEIRKGNRRLLIGTAPARKLADYGTFEDVIDAAFAEAREMLISKQRDYGPSNIEQAGEYGVALRANDKVQRLLNLLGSEKDMLSQIRKLFDDFSVNESMLESEFIDGIDDILNGGTQNEPVVDSWLDMCNYGIIGYILHEDAWGKPLSEDLPDDEDLYDERLREH